MIAIVRITTQAPIPFLPSPLFVLPGAPARAAATKTYHSPELARHLHLELIVVDLVELPECFIEALLQLVPGVRRLIVGRRCCQG